MSPLVRGECKRVEEKDKRLFLIRLTELYHELQVGTAIDVEIESFKTYEKVPKLLCTLPLSSVQTLTILTVRMTRAVFSVLCYLWESFATAGNGVTNLALPILFSAFKVATASLGITAKNLD